MLYSCFLKVLFTLSKSVLDSAPKRHLCIDAFQVKSKTLWSIFLQSAFTVDWFLCHNKEIKVIIRIARIALFHRWWIALPLCLRRQNQNRNIVISYRRSCDSFRKQICFHFFVWKVQAPISFIRSNVYCSLEKLLAEVSSSHTVQNTKGSLELHSIYLGKNEKGSNSYCIVFACRTADMF